MAWHPHIDTQVITGRTVALMSCAVDTITLYIHIHTPNRSPIRIHPCHLTFAHPHTRNQKTGDRAPAGVPRLHHGRLRGGGLRRAGYACVALTFCLLTLSLYRAVVVRPTRSIDSFLGGGVTYKLTRSFRGCSTRNPPGQSPLLFFVWRASLSNPTIPPTHPPHPCNAMQCNAMRRHLPRRRAGHRRGRPGHAGGVSRDGDGSVYHDGEQAPTGGGRGAYASVCLYFLGGLVV